MNESRDGRYSSAEEQALRAFKDTLMEASMVEMHSLFSDEEGNEERARERVRETYARVQEFRPEESDRPETPLVSSEILSVLRDGFSEHCEGERELPPRRVLVHTLAGLDYYFFEVACGASWAYDRPELSESERAAEHRLRDEVLVTLYEEMESAFDISPACPPDEASH